MCTRNLCITLKEAYSLDLILAFDSLVALRPTPVDFLTIVYGMNLCDIIPASDAVPFTVHTMCLFWRLTWRTNSRTGTSFSIPCSLKSIRYQHQHNDANEGVGIAEWRTLMNTTSLLLLTDKTTFLATTGYFNITQLQVSDRDILDCLSLSLSRS